MIKENVEFVAPSLFVQEKTLSFFAQKEQKVGFAHTELRRLRGLFIRAIFIEKKREFEESMKKLLILGREDSNLRMLEPKPSALPLGYTPFYF